MQQRGRKSAADLAVVTAEGLSAVRRPDPPEELTDEQAHEWRCITNRLPADWFPRETHGMLAQYCRHVIAARRVAQMIDSLESELAKEADQAEEGAARAAVILGAVKAMDRLLKMQEREGRAISSLATRMRISQQATLDREKRKPNKPEKRPWDS
jgi:hypothetical protein